MYPYILMCECAFKALSHGCIFLRRRALSFAGEQKLETLGQGEISLRFRRPNSSDETRRLITVRVAI